MNVLEQFHIPTTVTERPVLTERELAILAGMSFGHTNGQIARKVQASEDTVKTTARRLFHKLGTNDRAHAVRVGFELGILDSTLADIPPTGVYPETLARHGTAHWGHLFFPQGEEVDPVPAVFASGRLGGEIETGDFRLTLDAAEALAARINAAVRYQRRRAGAVGQP